MRRLIIFAIGLTLWCRAAVAEPPARKLPIGSHRPKLDFRLLDGSSVPSWSALRGHVVVIDFWASWCGPCVGAIDHLDALRKEMANEPVRFYSVTYEPKAKALAFLAKHPMTTTVGLDHDLATFRSLIAWGIPMTYVFDRQGNVAAVVYPTRLTAEALRLVLAGKIPDVEQHPGWNDPDGAAQYFREQLAEDRRKYGD